MIKNYFKTAIRNLLRHRSYALMNIVGLTVGVAACLLIFMITGYHDSFDTYHPKKDRIYRMVSEFKLDNQEVNFSPGVPFPVPEGLRQEFPQIEKAASVLGSGNDQMTIMDEHNQPGKKLKETSGVYYAEPAIFEIFDFKWLAGEAKSLADPNTVVLTRSRAIKYFGDWQQAMGRTIKFENTILLKVTGIIEDVPGNTDLPMEVILSFKTFKTHMLNDWVSIMSSHHCYVLLSSDKAASSINSQMAGFVKRHKPAENAKDGLWLQPLRDMHFDTRLGVFSRQQFSRELITALNLIGLFLLIVACVNFINLATAQAVNRAKEVGVRKVLGSNRRDLIMQFMGETLVITLLAVVLAVGVSLAVLTPVNALLNAQISVALFSPSLIIGFLGLIIVAVTILAGFYPALVLSGFNPITALKSRIAARGTGNISLRRALVILQFGIAQVLVISMLVVVGQMNYFKNASLGFTKDNLLNVPIPDDSLSHSKIDYLKAEIGRQAGVESISFSYGSPSENQNWSSDFKYGNTNKSSGFEANIKWADADFFKTYGLELVAGEALQESDTVRDFVVTETLVKKLGFDRAQDAIGTTINLWDGEYVARIRGVVKDFHARSLRTSIDPVIIACSKGQYRMFSVKMQAGKTATLLSYIDKLWTSTFPDYVYEYQFLDDKIDRYYQRESQLSTLYSIFAGIAIFISCLGLYGLVSFMAVQKIKEVGIRKVLGASIGNIVYLFSREFTILILVAFVIAAPVAWYLMNAWLQDFHYRIQIGAGIFLLAIAGSVAIGWLTAGYRSLRAALVNPVKSLKNE